MKLALGTVQFGLPYGAFNRGGAVPRGEIAACLDLAEQQGIDILDTARAYGESEARLGDLGAARRFRIVTKIAPLGSAGADAVAQSLEASLEALRTDRVECLLLHRADDLLGEHGAAVWAALETARERGQIERIGVSLYAPEEADAILTRWRPDVVQVPFSAFDRRFRTSGAFDRLGTLGVEVHARSLFLQGFALAAPDALPNHLASYRPALDRFRAAAQAAGISQLELALGAARHEPAIARAVVGIQSLVNFREIIAAAAKPAPAVDYRAFASEDASFINPSLWTATV